MIVKIAHLQNHLLVTYVYNNSQTKWGDSFPLRNTKTGLALRAKVDTTLAQVTFYLLEPHICKLFFAVWADWYRFFFFLKSNHIMSPFSPGKFVN